jgi:hypothetical protein
VVFALLLLSFLQQAGQPTAAVKAQVMTGRRVSASRKSGERVGTIMTQENDSSLAKSVVAVGTNITQPVLQRNASQDTVTRTCASIAVPTQKDSVSVHNVQPVSMKTDNMNIHDKSRTDSSVPIPKGSGIREAYSIVPASSARITNASLESVYYKQGMDMAYLPTTLPSVKLIIRRYVFPTCKVLYDEEDLNAMGKGTFGGTIMTHLNVDPVLRMGWWTGLKMRANTYLGTLRTQVNTKLKAAYLGTTKSV